MRPRHLGLLLLGVTAVSFSAVLVRLADLKDQPLAVAFYRNAMAAAVLVPIAVVRGREEFRSLDRRKLGLALLAGAFLAAHFSTWVPSLSFTTVAASSVLVTTQPVWIAAFGRVIGERVARATLLGIALALVGTLIISGGDFESSGRALLGDVLALAGGAFGAAYVLSGRNLRRDLSLLTYVSIVYTTCAAILAVEMKATGTPFTGFPVKTWVVFALLTLGPQIMGHTVFNYLLAYLDASVVTVAIMAEPVGATVLAFLILSENPPWNVVGGGAVLLAGVYLAIRAQARVAVAEAPVD
jgi:drug/metabolite transporter (DMT)-like permease